MRRLVAALVVTALVLMLAGCGGGGGTAQTTTPSSSSDQAAAPAPAPTAANGAAATANINRSENATTVFEPFPTGDWPAEVRSRINAKQPTLIYFYDAKQKTSAENRAIINEVREDNSGLVDLVAYDIGKYVETSEGGTITVDPKFADNKTSVQAVQLARALNVTFTPFIVLTDGQGYVIWQHRGLVDQAFLDREIQRAAR